MTLEEVINEFEEGLNRLKSKPNTKDNLEAYKFVKNVLGFLHELKKRRKADSQSQKVKIRQGQPILPDEDDFFVGVPKIAYKPVFKDKLEHMEHKAKMFEEIEPLIKENERIRKETWQEAMQDERKF
ncbi:MAG: hypothetical protein ACP6IQ_02580 [Candidatus Njordarchaeia archaeon]